VLDPARAHVRGQPDDRQQRDRQEDALRQQRERVEHEGVGERRRSAKRERVQEGQAEAHGGDREQAGGSAAAALPRGEQVEKEDHGGDRENADLGGDRGEAHL